MFNFVIFIDCPKLSERRNEKIEEIRKELNELQKTMIDILYFKTMLPNDTCQSKELVYRKDGNRYEIRHKDFIITIDSRQMEVLKIECKNRGIELVQDVTNYDLKDDVTNLEISSEVYESSSIDNACLISNNCELCTDKILSKHELKMLGRHLLEMKSIQRIDNYKIYKKDLVSLLGSNWLNDRIINSYCVLLQNAYAKNNVRFLTTYFYSTLIKFGYVKVDKWFTKIDLFEYQCIIIPIHLNNHWIVAQINNRNNTVYIFDSLGGYYRNVAVTLVKWIEHMASMSGRKKCYGCHFPKNIIKQTNGNDCGVFVLYYSKNICKRSYTTTKTSLDTSVVRLMIMHEIRIGKIIYDLDTA